jgi:hypothetical protein
MTPEDIEYLTIDDVRMRCMISNAVRLSKRSEVDVPLWSFVSQLTGYGCAYSTKLLKKLNLDPYISAKDLK